MEDSYCLNIRIWLSTIVDAPEPHFNPKNVPMHRPQRLGRISVMHLYPVLKVCPPASDHMLPQWGSQSCPEWTKRWASSAPTIHRARPARLHDSWSERSQHPTACPFAPWARWLLPARTGCLSLRICRPCEANPRINQRHLLGLRVSSRSFDGLLWFIEADSPSHCYVNPFFTDSNSVSNSWFLACNLAFSAWSSASARVARATQGFSPSSSWFYFPGCSRRVNNSNNELINLAPRQRALTFLLLFWFLWITTEISHCCSLFKF